jgi:predicted ATPase/transcriptional regulator with XRE-family HTH domain
MKPSKPRGECGDLIRRYREAAGLSQEALAERAGISPRGLIYLERGTHRPYPDTLNRLATALALTPQEREALALAARTTKSPRPASTKSGASTPPPDAAPPATEGTAEPPAGRGAVGQVATAPAGPVHNLPASLSSFIGREHAQARVRDLLASHRLVTLVGAGGVGKTRLALAVAAASLGAFPDGVWLVELAALADPGLAPGAVAEALGLREEPGRPVLETLRDHCGGKRLLLVLDNCEHLLAACAALAGTLLRAAPDLRILATSREALGVAGEHRYRVPSLSVPDPEHLPSPELAGTYEAVRLFVARAQERRDTFALTAANARAVAEICARLDGLPLAIELAAARIAAMSVAMIAAHLHDRFRLLTTGSGDLPTRQRTLQATLDWSWDLLDARERTLLGRLSVFAGGWTLEAAAAVCSGEGVEAPEILDLLSGLVEKSLVQVEAREGRELRYGLLESVRQYGQQRLATSGRAGAVHDRHLAHFLALAEEAEPALKGADQAAWIERLEAEHDNLRAALGWAREVGAAEMGLRLAGALWRFWLMRGHFHEGRAWLEGALAGAEGAAPNARAEALQGAGVLAAEQGDYGRAAALFTGSLALRRELGDRRGSARMLSNLGVVAYEQGEYGQAAALHEEALALCRELGDKRGLALALGNLGLVVMEQGEYGRAAALQEESLALDRELGDTHSIGVALTNLGWAVMEQGEYGRAAALLTESLVLARHLGNTYGSAIALTNLGLVALEQGDHTRATALHEEALALCRKLGDKRGIAIALGNLGLVAKGQGDHGRAAALLKENLILRHELGERRGVAVTLHNLGMLARLEGAPLLSTRLLAAASALRTAMGAPLNPKDTARYTQALAALRAALGEDGYAAAWADGRALPLDEAVALALEGTETPPRR